MRKIFDETKIGGMSLGNRIIRSATWEGMCAANGEPTSKLKSYYETVAKGGVGLIISGYAFVKEDGRQLPGQLGVTSDDVVPGLRGIADAVHALGARLCIQLVHCGGQATSAATGGNTVAPSAIKTEQYPELPSELNLEKISAIVKSFADAAVRVKAAGCDALQLHAAHGYLINQFLSPLTNRRNDEYGGTLINRCRFLLEVYKGIRDAVGTDFPVLVKLNGSDNLQGGLSMEDAVAASRLLDEEGIDAIEVSGGTPASGAMTPVRQKIDSREKEAYNLGLAYSIKRAVGCPVIVVGGMRSLETIESIIRRGEADYIALSRPFIREPDLPLRWKSGEDINSRCISCNGCFKPGLKEGGIYCVVEKIEIESRNASL